MSSGIMARFCAGCLLLGAPPWVAPASAAWSDFVPMGNTPLVGNPSCARYAEGSALCAAVGSGGKILFDFFNGKKWTGWKAEGKESVLSSDPSCTGSGIYDDTFYVICAARAATGKMAAYQYANGSYGGEVLIPLDIASAPSCAPLAGLQVAVGVLCAARTSNGQLASAFHYESAWSAPWSQFPLNTPVYSPIDCAPDNEGNAICAWLTVGNAVATAQLQFNNSNGTLAWSGVLNLSGLFSSPPVCSDAGITGQVGCFATGSNSSMYGSEFAGGSFTLSNWAGWGGFSGIVHGYGCADYGFETQVEAYACGVTGLTNSGFWTSSLSGGSWSNWVQQGTDTYIGSPSCFALTRLVEPGVVMCVVLKADGTTASITGP